MSLPKIRRQRTFWDADVALGRLLGRAPAGAARFLFFRDRIRPELEKLRPTLEAMYCADNGRPAEDPVELMGITVLQFMERLPDRQAADACTWDGRWKMALDLEIDEPGCHPTTLTRFRTRVVAYGLEGMGFDAVLEAMRTAGYLPKRGRQRLDSTHVLGVVSQMSRLECVREALRLALEGLEPIAALARPDAWAGWWERYVESKVDYQAAASHLQDKFVLAGQDARDLLQWAESAAAAQTAADAIALLRRVYGENFEETPDRQGTPRRAQPPGAVHNPHDPDAQWSTKDTTKQKSWVGYKVQVAETVPDTPREPGEPTRAVITAVVTQPATASDKAALPVVEEAWAATAQAKPTELYVDAGYTSGGELARAESEGRMLQGPVAPPPTREGRLSSEAFDVHVAERRAVCPAGQASTNCSRLEEQKTGTVSYRFEWNQAVCASCPLRAQCLGADQRHRTLVVGEHHGLLQARRREQKTESFQLAMRHRNAIEGTVSELVRGYGLRRARYRGLAKDRLQNWFIGAACNIKRWTRRVAWDLEHASGAPNGGQLAAIPA